MIGRVSVITDTGRRRRRNEDAYVCEPPLFAIADGMGGAQAGEVASRLAAAALRESGADRGGEDRIVDLVQEANRRVYDRSSSDPSTSGMGTTITVALVEEGQVAFGHVGDSRAYLIRDGRMEQVTEDHSLVNELLKSGKLSREEAETHPQRSVITRALGTDPDVDVDTFTIAGEEGDLFLLCSDGLTDMVSERAILDLVERYRHDIDRALRALVNAANKGGGEDNITVVAFEIAGGAPLAHDGDTREHVLEEEQTLTELDAVPAVDTAVVSADAIQAEVAAKERDERAIRRRHLRRRVLAWLALLLIVAGIAIALYVGYVR
ncbi:MAG TPA: Stp1/IreP family PP2C-type Ser/Thr phosphatase [Gaiellaceae bacterium]|jgi:protein phosphatase|nr:Stp1/IreP family PP2C-type Ser/Thr phosphatase [Gaiellaceae bacterium]